ncbi:MAG: DUF2127 domain-containing protein [Clostridiales bacterium]|nr:DUF2127 domain-containing protein [Clostridiales bacterium]
MNPEYNKKRKDIFHIGFELGLLLKGINSLLEIISGILMIFLNTTMLNRITLFLTQTELLEDPRDRIANALLHFSQGYTHSTQYFGIFYLLSHGIIKAILVVLLWRRKMWAYPLGVIFLFLFVLYQMYRYTFTHSISLVLLSFFDIILIVLTLIEFQKQKSVIRPEKNE